MKLRTLALFAALLAATPGLHAQVGPSIRIDKVTGKVTIDVPNGAVIQQNQGNTVIYWSVAPPPPDPGPGPSPDPKPPGPPDPPPTPPEPEWGPIERLLILEETSKRTGRESYLAQPVRDAINDAVRTDTTGVPLWRQLDKDTSVTDVPEWAEFADKAKKKHAGSNDPVLYAIDAKGAMKDFPLKGLSDAETIALVQSLKAAK